MFDVEDDVSFDELDATKFFWLSTAYSVIDSIITHPFFVTTSVAEFHKSVPKMKNICKPARFPYLIFRSNGNLNFFEAVNIMTHSQTGGANIHGARLLLRQARSMYTGFNVAMWGFLFGDVTQMMAYNYIKTRVDQMIEKGSLPQYWPAPLTAGFVSMSICALPCNATMVLFRQQVYLRTRGQDYSFRHVVFERLPNLEGGACRSLLRGTIVSSISSVPSVAVSWQVYETTKEKVRAITGSNSVFTSAVSGSMSGVVDAIVNRPVSVVTARMHTDVHPQGFWKTASTMLREEGASAFYKGIGSQMMANIPRMGLFFSVYQTFLTLAKKPEFKHNHPNA
jgi:hypothetical protein